MNPQAPDELISAYFDGEVTPEERAAVERLLAESDEAQRELNETARLSALLHSFPREAAPAGLADDILRQTSQIALPPRPAPAKSPSSRNVWREWRAGMISAVTTALGILICWGLWDSSKGAKVHDEASPFGRATADNHVRTLASPSVASRDRYVDGAASNGVSIEPAMKKMVSQVDESLKEVAKQSPAAAKLEVSQREAAPEESDKSSVAQQFGMRKARSVLPSPSPMADAAVELSARDSQQIDSNQLGLSNEDFLKGLHEGKVYTFVPQPADPGSNVAVVSLTVVDINRGLQKIEVLLKNNSIEPRSAGDDGQGTPNDLVLVLTEASGDRLAKTLEEIQKHSDLFPEWNSQPPLQVAANEATDAERAVGPSNGKKDLATRNSPVASKPGANQPIPDAELPEVERVFDAYVARNGIQISNGQVTGRNRGGNDGATLQRHFGGNAQEKEKMAATLQQRGANLNAEAQGYDVRRMNNSLTQTNPVLQPLRQENMTRRSLNYAGQPAMKAQNPESNNRALRMLFVLHPPEMGQGFSGAASPAKANH